MVVLAAQGGDQSRLEAAQPSFHLTFEFCSVSSGLTDSSGTRRTRPRLDTTCSHAATCLSAAKDTSSFARSSVCC